MQISAYIRNSPGGHEVQLRTAGAIQRLAVSAKASGPGSAANGGGSNWIGTYTIDGTTYNNVTKNVVGQCSDIADTSQNCATRKGFACVYGPTTVAAFCQNQTSSVTTGGTTTRYPVYNRNAAENNLVHDCKADEPANNGPWPHMALHLTPELDLPFYRVSRPESAAPSVGSASVHQEEARTLLKQAFS